MHAAETYALRIFQGGGGAAGQTESTQQIVMSFPPLVVGCLLKRRLNKGGSGALQDPPSYASVPLSGCKLKLRIAFCPV